MKLSQALGGTGIPAGVGLEEVFDLVFEVVETGARREALYRHANFLSYAQIRIVRAEREFVKRSCNSKVDFCPVRGPDAPSAPGQISTEEARRPSARERIIPRQADSGGFDGEASSVSLTTMSEPVVEVVYSLIEENLLRHVRVRLKSRFKDPLVRPKLSILSGCCFAVLDFGF
jgi:hypothetical protein